MTTRQVMLGEVRTASIDIMRRALGFLVALAAFATAWTTLKLPVPATTTQIALLQATSVQAVEDLREEHVRLHRIVWTDKLLSYQARLDLVDQNIRNFGNRKAKVPDVYYMQKTMLVGQVREAERALRLE